MASRICRHLGLRCKVGLGHRHCRIRSRRSSWSRGTRTKVEGIGAALSLEREVSGRWGSMRSLTIMGLPWRSRVRVSIVREGRAPKGMAAARRCRGGTGRVRPSTAIVYRVVQAASASDGGACSTRAWSVRRGSPNQGNARQHAGGIREAEAKGRLAGCQADATDERNRVVAAVAEADDRLATSTRSSTSPWRRAPSGRDIEISRSANGRTSSTST